MAIMGICLVVFLAALYRGSRILDAMMFAVALAVAAIPEALGTIVTIVQAMGTQRMAKQNAIIKDLKAVESLGCVSVICSDKTGTLTQNKMSVQAIYENGRSTDVLSGHRAGRAGKQGELSVLEAAVLANDGELVNGREYLGSPTEIALLQMAADQGICISAVRNRWSRLEENPFDSKRKRMSVLCRRQDGKQVLVVKGAWDVLMPRCTHIEKNGRKSLLTLREIQDIKSQNEKWGQEGLRVLAFAYRTGGKTDDETDLTFIGLAAMMDPPRPESGEAVRKAREAGIKPVMITGDHPATAKAIAEKIQIFLPGEMVVAGSELDQMTDRELDKKLEDISVYARVSPEHKIRIVEAWQRKGSVVAMTGDGVNDGPALKKADVGVAMGLGGTEVSRDAASMILSDDNFATIISAVENGRNVYRNIQNAIDFLLSGNMAGIFCVLYTSLLALPMPFAPVHLLFINLVTDSLPALAIGMEPAEDGLLKQKPRDPSKGIMNPSFIKDIFIQGGLIAVCTMAAYYAGLASGPAVAATMAFSTLTMARLFHGFNCRSHHSIFYLGLFSNLYSIMAFEAGAVLLAAVLFVPELQNLFAASDLTMKQIGMTAIVSLVPTIVIQGWKMAREWVKS